ncbi:MAG: tetratricopeptide repeat protein [Proteobacteria bacterium]|nr:tetratricopeptide repeat protein [Pseudomonadota bacterium]
MRRLALSLWFMLALASIPAIAQQPDTLQRGFVEGMQHLQAGEAAQAERVFRAMLERTDSARVKLELARSLYAQGKLEEAKALFREVSVQAGTLWRVRDNIANFVTDIEERTGYLKLGVTVVSDSNPRNLAPQEEFSIGNLRVTPTEAPEKVWGLRYALRGWRPFSASGRTAGYVSAAYSDFPGQEIDRMTLDLGVVQALTDSGRVRGKAGVEAGTFGGHRLYDFPYLGLDAVLAQAPLWRLTGETKIGKVRFADFDYLDADFASAALAVRRRLTASSAGSLRVGGRALTCSRGAVLLQRLGSEPRGERALAGQSLHTRRECVVRGAQVRCPGPALRSRARRCARPARAHARQQKLALARLAVRAGRLRRGEPLQHRILQLPQGESFGDRGLGHR